MMKTTPTSATMATVAATPIAIMDVWPSLFSAELPSVILPEVLTSRIGASVVDAGNTVEDEEAISSETPPVCHGVLSLAVDELTNCVVAVLTVVVDTDVVVFVDVVVLSDVMETVDEDVVVCIPVLFPTVTVELDELAKLL
jgi:hypothetical protein